MQLYARGRLLFELKIISGRQISRCETGERDTMTANEYKSIVHRQRALCKQQLRGSRKNLRTRARERGKQTLRTRARVDFSHSSSRVERRDADGGDDNVAWRHLTCKRFVVRRSSSD